MTVAPPTMLPPAAERAPVSIGFIAVYVLAQFGIWVALLTPVVITIAVRVSEIAGEAELKAADLSPEPTPFSTWGLRLPSEPPPNVQAQDAFKAGQIESWLDERRNDGVTIMSSTPRLLLCTRPWPWAMLATLSRHRPDNRVRNIEIIRDRKEPRTVARLISTNHSPKIPVPRDQAIHGQTSLPPRTTRRWNCQKDY